MASLAEPAKLHSSHELVNSVINGLAESDQNDTSEEIDENQQDSQEDYKPLTGDLRQKSSSNSPTKSVDSAMESNLKRLETNGISEHRKGENYDSDGSDSDNTGVGLNYEDYDENFCPKNEVNANENVDLNTKQTIETCNNEPSQNHTENEPLHTKYDTMTNSHINNTAKTPDGKSRRVNPFNTFDSAVSTERMPTLLSSYEQEPSSPTHPQTPDELNHDPQFELMPAKMKELNKFNEQIADLQKVIKEVKIKTQSPINSYTPPPVNAVSSPWVKQDVSNEPTTPENDSRLSPNRPTEPEIEKHDSSKAANIDNKNHQNCVREKSAVIHGNVDEAEGSSASGGSEIVYVPGPCEPEDLIEGIIFTANYLGSTQLMSEKNPAKNSRMFQAQEAVSRIKAPDGEHQPSVEVDLFISTAKVKVLNADTQETMMEHFLRSISYIADIGELLVIMAKRRPPRIDQDEDDMIRVPKQDKRNRIICHVFSSPDAHLMAQAIGQAFNVAYQQFLRANGIEPQTLTQDDFNTILDTQEMYHDDLVHYSKQENIKELWIEKSKGEGMGIVVVESGWGSILPTVVLANMQHGSAVERSGKMSIGDQIMAINSTSLVGLPLQTCHSIIKGLRNHTLVKVNIVSCPPVVTVLIKRPDLKYQLGFSVQNGIICSLMRGGIAERGGVRVGHRIIEINSQSVVATPHDKIVQMLVTSVGEIQMKTMPAAMYRLLTGQEQPIYM